MGLTLPKEGKDEIIASLKATIANLEGRISFLRDQLAEVEAAEIREKYDDKHRPEGDKKVEIR